MNISRKDFFRKSLFSLGEAVATVAGALQSAPVSEGHQDQQQESSPVPPEDAVAAAENAQCLGKNCGCFACIERCEQEAIMLVAGEGIRIDQARCNGCGACEYVCPVTPKAIRMVARTC